MCKIGKQLAKEKIMLACSTNLQLCLVFKEKEFGAFEPLYDEITIDNISTSKSNNLTTKYSVYSVHKSND